MDKALYDHLMSLDGNAIPDAFLDVVLPLPRNGTFGVKRDAVLGGVNVICPPHIFDNYVEAYLQRPDLLTSDTFKNSLQRFIGILRSVMNDAMGNQFYDGSDDSEMREPERYVAPNFAPRNNLAGVQLSGKSTFAEKLHAIDLIIENPNILIAYAALDAAMRDYFSEGLEALKDPLSKIGVRQQPPAYSKTRNAFAVLDHTTSQTRLPSLGIVHGLLTQTYFRHLCNCVNENRLAGQWQHRDVMESIASFHPTQMFMGEKPVGAGEKQQAVCPMQRLYIVAALGFSKRRTSNVHTARLWSVMQKAQKDLGLQQQIKTELEMTFLNTLHAVTTKERPFIRPGAHPA